MASVFRNRRHAMPVFFSAGNGRLGHRPNQLGLCPHTLTVGGSRVELYEQSSSAPHLTKNARSSNLRTAFNNPISPNLVYAPYQLPALTFSTASQQVRYGIQKGTSFSTPYVAGGMARWLSLYYAKHPDSPKLTADDMGKVLRDGAKYWLDLISGEEVPAGTPNAVPVFNMLGMVRNLLEPQQPVNEREWMHPRQEEPEETGCLGAIWNAITGCFRGGGHARVIPE
jgi:hypothetical protein